MEHPPCPYCGKELHLDPQARVKCMACERWVYPGRDHEVLDHHPLTEEENEAVRQLEMATRGFTLSWSDVHEIRDQLTEQVGHEPDISDLLWRVWNELLTRQPERAPQIHLEMARQLHREGEDPSQQLDLIEDVTGRVPRGELRGIWTRVARFESEIGMDPTPELVRARRIELERYEGLGANSVRVSTMGDGCHACEELAGEHYSVDRALEEMPLPNPKCTHVPEENAAPLCRCSWQAESFETAELGIDAGRESGCAVALLTLPVGLIARLLAR